MLLLAEPERTLVDVTDFPQEYLEYLTHRFIMERMLSRCSDVASTVRTRAIAVFSQCAESPEDPISSAIKDLVTPVARQKQAVSRIPDSLMAADSIGQGRNTTDKGDNDTGSDGSRGRVPVLRFSAGSCGGLPTNDVEANSERVSAGTIAMETGTYDSENITPQNSVISASGLRIPSAMKTVALTPG